MKNNLGMFPEGLAVSDVQHGTEVGDSQSGPAHLDASCRETSRELEHLGVRQRAQQKALKSQFNVFTAVLKYDDEVRLHSRWLHYLLNPKAEHDCEELFLNLFIQTLRQQGAQRHADDRFHQMDELPTFARDSVEVLKEHHTKHGNTDIQIESPEWLIVIENKTKSGEGENQIHDYAKYCDEHCSQGKRKFRLLFLTPDGREAQTAGDYKDQYFRISYRRHILPWIEECLRATYQYVHINQALQQYKNVVNQILNLSSDTAYMKEVTEILKKHPPIIEHLADIDQAVKELRENYWNEFVCELRKLLGAHDITLGRKIDCYGGPYFYVEPSNSFRRNSFPELKTTLQCDEGCLCIGETVYPPRTETRKEFWDRKRDKLKPVVDRLVSAFPGAYHSEGTEAWPLGWAKFLKGFMSLAFLAKNATQHSPPMHKQVAVVAEDISRYLKILEEAWPEATA